MLAATVVIASRISTAAAQSTVVDEEPNDTPQTAIEVTAPATIAGSMASGDQDAYNWVISDVDAGKRWTVVLDGIPGLQTVVYFVSVTYNDDGEATGSEKWCQIYL